MSSLFNFSFFITQKMKTQLREGPVYGTLPILYVFLARTGKTIHEVNFVRLDEQGSLQIADELDATNGETTVRSQQGSAASGVKIVFSDGNGPRQTLYYFSTNLADGSFQRSGFSAFLARLGPADSLIKSASYLLHNAHFAGVRKLLMDNSATIVQDDSGIPLTYFEATKWRVQAFGHYAGPISMFANFYQPRMAELFQSASPLDFRQRSANPVTIEQSQGFVQPLPTPSRPTGALSFPSTQHVAPNLLFHPGDLCHEAPALPVAQPSRSSATGSIDNSPGGISSTDDSRLRGARPKRGHRRHPR